MLYLQQFRKYKKLSFLLIVFFSFLTTVLSEEISAEISFDSFRGLWLTQLETEPIYLIFKKNNNAHYLFVEGPDTSIYKGYWSYLNSKEIKLQWDNGTTAIFDPLKKEFQASSNSNQTANNQTVAAEKIDDSLLGAWAKPYDYVEQKNTDIPTDFFGLWEIQNNSNEALIRIQKNRMVYQLSATNDPNQAINAMIGRWAKHGKQLHIIWENGSYSVVDNTNPNLVKLYPHIEGQFILDNEAEAPFKTISTDLSARSQAFWEGHSQVISNLKSIHLNTLNYKELNKFYRGDWIVSHKDDQGLLQLGRFGGVDYYYNQHTKGNWYLTGNSLLINLENGSRLRLEIIGTGFLLSRFDARRPLDGYPNQIFQVAPLEKEKLYQFNVKPKSAIALRNKHLGLSETKNQRKAYLNSFQKQAADKFQVDPWWWPIWSENPENIGNKDLTNNSASVASSNEETKKPGPDIERHRKLNSSWQWPF